MTLEAKFSLEKKALEARFGAIQTASDGGYDRGFAEGKQAEYDRFWNAVQDYGNRTNYTYAFHYGSWNDVTFKPKYDLRPTGDASRMFESCIITDLKGILERQGVVLDLSNVTWAVNTFYQMRENTRLPELDMRNLPELSFSLNTALKSIDKLILKDDGTNSLYFTYCYALEEIRFEGVIGQSLDMKHCSKLSYESLDSIITHLKDLTGQTAQTLTLHNVAGNKLTDAQKAIVTAKNWILVY